MLACSISSNFTKWFDFYTKTKGYSVVMASILSPKQEGKLVQSRKQGHFGLAGNSLGCVRFVWGRQFSSRAVGGKAMVLSRIR